tara:strand:+ start:579 stop:755 length:177 start_codon:yes stop_codon:yes gene_type:complete
MAAQESGVGHGPVTVPVGDRYDGGDALFLNPAQTELPKDKTSFNRFTTFRASGLMDIA